MLKPSKFRMNSAAVARFAELVQTIPDQRVRELTANHFAQQLNRMYAGFDPGRWAQATGGRLTGPTRLEDAA